MDPRFTVLASGSAGNASLLEADGFGLLVDIGLGPRQLADRLAAVDRSWQNVRAVLLTHLHTDHWKRPTLAALAAKRIPLYCHDEHLEALHDACSSSLWRTLDAAKLLRTYAAGQELLVGEALHCRPLALRHDCGATFGFRFSGADQAQHWSLGYAADLGSWDEPLAEALGDVDLLALEFNHDVVMQRSSGRHPQLIERVLGDEGHLSNKQAAELLRAALSRSQPPRCRQVVQLHLSRQCNRPDLALKAARAVIRELGLNVSVHTAAQDQPSPTFELGEAAQCSAPF